MKYYKISEEDLKNFIRTIRELTYENDPRFYTPSDEDLEPTEDDLKEYEEIKDEITDEITDIDIHNEKIPVVLEVTKVSKFEPNFDSLFEEDE